MDQIDLTPEQEEEAKRIEAIIQRTAGVEIRRMSRLLASKENRELFGETEFQIRGAVHRVGAQALDAALTERKKRGIKGRASRVRSAERTRASSDTATVL